MSDVKAILILVACSSVASADSWTEVGLARSQVDMGDGHTVQGYSVQFSPRFNLNKAFYAGAELDGGRISGDIATPQVFRVNGGEMAPTSTVNGEAYAIAALVGMRLRAGVISGGGELVAGFHRAELRDARSLELATVESDTPMLQGRARLDLWVSPQLSVGGVVGVELDDPKDMMAGLMVGLHFEPYDGMR
jgi:hypothetical protein